MNTRFSGFAAAVLVLGLGASYAGVQLASAHERSDAQKRTFVGEVTRNWDNKNQMEKYILYDENGATNYFLDDRGKAAKYDEKKVEIVGTLDQANTTIHVDSIEGLG